MGVAFSKWVIWFFSNNFSQYLTDLSWLLSQRLLDELLLFLCSTHSSHRIWSCLRHHHRIIIIVVVIIFQTLHLNIPHQLSARCTSTRGAWSSISAPAGRSTSWRWKHLTFCFNLHWVFHLCDVSCKTDSEVQSCLVSCLPCSSYRYIATWTHQSSQQLLFYKRLWLKCESRVRKENKEGKSIWSFIWVENIHQN